MNKLIVLFFMLISLSTSSQKLNGIIEYGKKSKKQILSKSDLKRMKENPEKHLRFQKMREMITQSEKKISFELKFNKNESFFNAKLILKSEANKKRNLGFGAYDLGKYYSNSEINLLELNAFGELFLIEKPKLKWIVEKETKKIGKYNCYKAITEINVNSKGKKRIITAWFTPEIPVSFGPVGYVGLPGLILELEVYKKVYYVKKIILNSKEDPKIERPYKGVKVTEREFQNIGNETMRKFKKNKGF